MKTAEQERAQIVKYLRETAEIFDDLIKQGNAPLKHRHHADSCRFSAEYIELGEHWYAPKTAEKA